MFRRDGLLRWSKRAALALLLAALGLNVVAYLHAGAMLNWSEGGARSRSPEELGFLGKLRVLVAGVSVPRPRNHRTPLDSGLEYETRRIPNGHGDELDAWYVPGGARILVALFPAYAGSKGSLLYHALAFRDLGASVLLVDTYGVGDSSGTGTSLGIFESRDVAAVTAYARASWPGAKLVLYGPSLGGAAVLRAVACEGAEPDAIAVESTFDRLLTTVGARFHRMGLPATPLAQALVFWGGVRLGVDAFEHDPVEFAARVTCPALVLHGSHDRDVSSSEARSLHAALGGWKRYAESPLAGHANFLASDHERWRQEVAELLAQLGVR